MLGSGVTEGRPATKAREQPAQTVRMVYRVQRCSQLPPSWKNPDGANGALPATVSASEAKSIEASGRDKCSTDTVESASPTCTARAEGGTAWKGQGCSCIARVSRALLHGSVIFLLSQLLLASPPLAAFRGGSTWVRPHPRAVWSSAPGSKDWPLHDLLCMHFDLTSPSVRGWGWMVAHTSPVLTCSGAV